MSKNEPIRFYWQGKPSNEMTRDELLDLVLTLQRQCADRVEEVRRELDAAFGVEPS